MIKLKALSATDAEQIRLWRNDCLEALRTPYPLTREQQEDWYNNTVCDRRANARWFGIHADYLIGYTGIENISWENRRGEISLLIDPHKKRKGYGKAAADWVLEYAFYTLNLETVYGECYYCNETGIAFWLSIVENWDGVVSVLPRTKYLDGNYYDSLYFTISRQS